MYCARSFIWRTEETLIPLSTQWSMTKISCSTSPKNFWWWEGYWFIWVHSYICGLKNFLSIVSNWLSTFRGGKYAENNDFLMKSWWCTNCGGLVNICCSWTGTVEFFLKIINSEARHPLKMHVWILFTKIKQVNLLGNAHILMLEGRWESLVRIYKQTEKGILFQCSFIILRSSESFVWGGLSASFFISRTTSPQKRNTKWRKVRWIPKKHSKHSFSSSQNMFEAFSGR